MQLTQSQEDYLETIYVLKSQQENVRAIDVAAALGFSKPSVSHALKDLKEKELIYTDKTGYLFFTEQGQKQASQVYERHIYFKNQLLHAGVVPVLAEEACRMEHTISEESFKKLKGSKCVRSCIDCKGDDCK
ncbi:MAG: metal-dependent transcriptional regulator [Holdemanella sp.]|uniref:metal-dependent transcriptional regulator n=1 Tax=Holdemanella sp. TaxID=1971762 RepID=UPI002E7604B2|nr:metal-dependent transcriptional regulator [Holdemanella sp.]MEE0079784.1 metal-dependent transcriptional regulator [Holdemanella sp.]